MKSLNFIQETDNSMNQIAPKSVRAGRVFRSFLGVCMLSSVLLLSSCAVGVRTPRQHTSGIIIRSHTRVERPVRVRHIRVVKHHHRAERHDRREHRNHRYRDRDDD